MQRGGAMEVPEWDWRVCPNREPVASSLTRLPFTYQYG